MPRWKIASVILAASVLTGLNGCSGKTLTDVEVITPPQELLADCPEPKEEQRVLELLKENKPDDAAVEYVRYVLDVRDSYQLCNGRLKSAREYCRNMREALKGGNK